MKFLIDGYWWVNGPPSGRMVLLETVRAWRNAFPSDELIVAIPQRHLDKVNELAGVQVVPVHGWLHPIINRVALPRLAKRLSVDGLLTQNFYAPHPGSVVYVHDVLFMTNPEWFSRVERLYMKFVRHSARIAPLVLTSSHSEAARIRRVVNPKGRVVATGLSPSHALLTNAATAPADRPTPGQFSLTVGRLNVRKNLETLIDAYLMSGLASADFPLVIVGEASGVGTTLSTAAKGAEEAKQIVFAGGVPDSELRWYYEHCRFFVCSSLDEGFGLPPTEARAFGAPVLTSDIPVFREAFANDPHVRFMNPRSRESIVLGLQAMTSDASANPADPIEVTSWQDIAAGIRSEILSRATKDQDA